MSFVVELATRVSNVLVLTRGLPKFDGDQDVPLNPILAFVEVVTVPQRYVALGFVAHFRVGDDTEDPLLAPEPLFRLHGVLRMKFGNVGKAVPADTRRFKMQ